MQYFISWCINVGADNTYDLQMKKDMNLLLNKYAPNEGFFAQCWMLSYRRTPITSEGLTTTTTTTTKTVQVSEGSSYRHRLYIQFSVSTIALMHVYVTQANFTTKPRFEIKNKRSFTEMNSQGSRVEKNTHAQKVQMQKILFTNEACWWNLLVWRNHA